jgi:hypothetical protein
MTTSDMQSSSIQDNPLNSSVEQQHNALEDLLLGLQRPSDGATGNRPASSGSLENLGTDSLYATNSGREPAASGQDKVSMPYFTPLPGTSQVAPSEYYQPAPIETLNNLLLHPSGALTFSDPVGPTLTTGERLLRQFNDEIKDGTISQDPLWQKFSAYQQQNKTSITDLTDLIEALKTESQSPEVMEAKKELQDAILKKEPAKLIELLKNNPEIKKVGESLEQAKIEDGESTGEIRAFATTHKEVAHAVDSKEVQQEKAVAAEHKRLADWADKNLPPADRDQFKADMATFEQRAKAQGLSPEEVLKTYKQMERLADATGDKPIPTIQRQRILESVMHQTAVPTDVSQGFNGTCNVASIESRTYTREPSSAVKLVTDVALTGQYIAPDGTTVKINTNPDREAADWPTKDGARSHASELFQLTAVNLYYEKENKMTGKDIHYEKEDPKNGDRGDTGERLYDYSGGKKVPVKTGTFLGFGGTPVEAPGLNCQKIADVSDIILGRNEKDVVLVAGQGKEERGATEIQSEDQLRAKLKELKDNHKLPAIVYVDTENEPFFTDQGCATSGGKGGAHVVTITDYDEKTGAVCIDNQWNKAADHGRNNPVNVHDLYIAMHWHTEAEQLLKQDVDWNRAHGTPDPSKEVDLIRHQLKDGTIKPEEAEKKTAEALDDMIKLQNQGKVNDAEKLREWKEIEAVIHQLPLDAQARLVKQAHDGNVITTAWYKEELALIGYQIIHTKNHEKTTPGNRKIEDAYYQKQVDAWALDLSDLSTEDNQDIINEIQGRLKVNP